MFKTTIILTVFYLLPNGEIEHRESPKHYDSVKACIHMGMGLSSHNENSIGFECDLYAMKKKVSG